MSSSLAADRRQGVVVAVNATSPPTVTVALGGDLTSTYPARYSDAYWPLVGDDVMVLSNQGTHWVLGTSYGPPGHAELSNQSPVASTTSATFVTVASTTSATFTKRRAGTRLRLDLRVSGYVSAVNTEIEWGLQLTTVPGGVATDVPVVDMMVNGSGAHAGFSGIAYAALDPGDYNARLRVRRPAGTGSVVQDSGDYVIYDIDEVP